MKKTFYQIVLFCSVFVFRTDILVGQGAYISIGTGYGFKSSSQNLGNIDFADVNFVDYTQSQLTDYTDTEEQINVSLGKGLNLSGAFGYMFNKNTGMELGLSYLIGGTYEAQSAIERVNQFSNTITTQNSAISAKMLRIIPSLVLSAGMEKINPYAKFGFVIGTGSINFETSTSELDFLAPSNSSNITKAYKLDGGLALGFSSSLGAQIKLSEKTSIFGELNMINLSYAPTKGELTEFTEDGVNYLPFLTTNDTQIDFVDSYTYSSTQTILDTEPSKDLKEKYPFGSFGLNFGLRIGF